MAQREKTREVIEVYLVTVCDGCESENVAVNDGENVYCDACFTKQQEQPASTEDVAAATTLEGERG